MSIHEDERALRSANPVSRERLDGLDFEAMEADLLADVGGEGSAPVEVAPPRLGARHPRRIAVAVGTAAVAIAVAAVVIFAGGASEHPSRAYGADLVRFAEASPLLLLEGPGWRVQNVVENRERAGIYGSMEFVTGKPVPYESIEITGNDEEGQHAKGLQPVAERQRRVNLSWRHGSLAETIAYQRSPKRIHPHGRHFTRLPVLNTTAFVDTDAEVFVNQGGPGDREMVAIWGEDGYVLTLQAAVPSLAAMEERLGWLTKVDQAAWLEAMPAKVVKASDHDAAVREVLKGVPTPKTFRLSRVPDEGLTTDRYQVGAQATGTVACLWFRQWGEGVRTGDEAAVEEAVRAMGTSRRWPILREMTKEGDWSHVLWEDAKWMPKGYFEWDHHKRDLLAHAEGLGCARQGIPLTPKKMAIARERGGPPPPPR